jgi:hypothetical protein
VNAYPPSTIQGDVDHSLKDGSAADEDQQELLNRIESYANENKNLQGLVLSRCQLAGIDLVKRGSSKGYDFSYSDFYRANLQGAHLFGTNFQHASLMKTDLRNANLHCADLRYTNLLGTRLEGARIDNVQWDERVIQEVQAHQALKRGHQQQALDYLEQAEEIYRNLRLSLEKAGLFEQAGYFFHREMTMRRLQMPLFSARRFVSRTVDLFCGYGEKPLRVVLFSLSLVFVCAILYFLVGIRQGDIEIGFDLSQGLLDNVLEFFSCLYFSVVTFTTLGYGDLTPIGAVRPIAAVEAFSGSFTMALFVVVFVKKMTR